MLFFFPEKKDYIRDLPLMEYPHVVQLNQKEELVISVFEERGSAIDEKSKRSYESRPNYISPLTH